MFGALVVDVWVPNQMPKEVSQWLGSRIASRMAPAGGEHSTT